MKHIIKTNICMVLFLCGYSYICYGAGAGRSAKDIQGTLKKAIMDIQKLPKGQRQATMSYLIATIQEETTPIQRLQASIQSGWPIKETTFSSIFFPEKDEVPQTFDQLGEIDKSYVEAMYNALAGGTIHVQQEDKAVPTIFDQPASINFTLLEQTISDIVEAKTRSQIEKERELEKKSEPWWMKHHNLGAFGLAFGSALFTAIVMKQTAETNISPSVKDDNWDWSRYSSLIPWGKK